MKTGNHKNISKFAWVAIAVVAIVALAGIFRVLAFTGPTLGGGVGSGALGTDAAGNVSVGTSTTQSNTKFFVLGSTTNSSAYGMQIWNSANAPLLVVRNDGNVGIGTTATAYRLQVTNPSGGTGSTLLTTNDYANGSTGSALLIDFGAASGNTYTRLSAYSAGLTAYNNLVLQSGGGNVSIGTTTASQPLTVQGNIYATGNITCGGTCGGGGSGTVTSIIAGSGLSGGTITNSGTISLNVGNPNTWTGAQTFNNNSYFQNAIWNTSGYIGIGTQSPSSYVSAGGPGVSGAALYGTATYGVYGSGSTDGVYGNGGPTGVYGTGTSYGVYGTSGDAGVYGNGNFFGVFGAGSLYGVYGSGSTWDFGGSNSEHTSGGTWVNGSDRNIKENFTAVDDQAVLGKIIELPITQWNYKTDKKGLHIGPMAQDFYAIFGLGDDNLSISTVDPSGIALVGIKALNEKIDAQQKEIDALQAEIKSLSH